VYRNILVVLSDPRTSPDVLSEAIAIAERGRGRLTLLCPVPRPPAWLSAPMTAAACEPLARELQAEAEQTLCTARQAVPGCIPLTTILAPRGLRDALRSRLAEHPHDLLVLGRERLGRRLERCCSVPIHRVLPAAGAANGSPAPRRRSELDGIELPAGAPLAGGLELA
jgi:nucleotide-binding universal stress UspA family protein